MTIKKIILGLVSVIFSIGLSAQSNTEDYSLKFYTYIGGKPDMNYVDNLKNIVIAITSQFMPRAKDRIELIKKHIIPNI